MTQAVYPPAPTLADTSFLEPSPAFKSKTYRMIVGIVLFILLYILLIAFGIGLLIATGALAVLVVSAFAHWITIVIAAGLITLGGMFFFFTIKFLFSRTREEDPMEIEITERDQPQLFDFIRKLSKEVGTDFPRKIFLTADVNASVSYDSSFWSMFFPVRKNLRIGLGLVNSLNLSEFKATIAHEFGHFSQRSMTAGSYVYTANKVIFNLAYQYDRFDVLLNQWRGTGGIFGGFAVLTSFFVEGVRKILRSSYGALNVNYMALSREMEYHADLVACSAAGNEAMVNTLRKTEFADVAYQETIGTLNTLGFAKKRKVNDLYAIHSRMMLASAKHFKLEVSNGQPVITGADLHRNFLKSRLFIKDQWASHPSREEREASINQRPLQSPIMTQSAWVVFEDIDNLKSMMTAKLYGTGEFKDLDNATGGEIDDLLEGQRIRSSISPTFHGIYDNRWLPRFTIADITEVSTTKSFASLINETNTEMVKKHFRDAADLEQLEAIARKDIKVDFFEYDEVRYKAKRAHEVALKLKDEVNKSRADMEELDLNILRYYYQLAKESGEGEKFLGLCNDVQAKATDMDIATNFVIRFQNWLVELQTRVEWSEVHMNDLCRSVNDLETEVKNVMKSFSPALIEEYYPDPANVSKYLAGNNLWNSSLVNFSNEGFAKLEEYISAMTRLTNAQLWDATKALYDKELSLTPQQYVRTE
jgi:Zn-dependent protease with chaperone function